MKKNKKSKWEINSKHSLYAAIFVVIFLLSMAIGGLMQGFYFFSFLLALGSFWYIYSLRNLNFINGFENKFIVGNYWTKKEIISIHYCDVSRILVEYWSDTPGRGKIISFVLLDGKRIKAEVAGIYMMDLNSYFRNSEIPLYIKKNDKFILYKSQFPASQDF